MLPSRLTDLILYIIEKFSISFGIHIFPYILQTEARSPYEFRRNPWTDRKCRFRRSARRQLHHRRSRDDWSIDAVSRRLHESSSTGRSPTFSAKICNRTTPDCCPSNVYKMYPLNSP